MGAFIVSTKDGDKVVITHAVTGVDFKAGKPGKPAQPAKEAVEGKPGRPADHAKGDLGEPPVEAIEAQEAQPAEEGEPDVVTFKSDGGSVDAQGMTLRQAVDLLNRS